MNTTQLDNIEQMINFALDSIAFGRLSMGCHSMYQNAAGAVTLYDYTSIRATISYQDIQPTEEFPFVKEAHILFGAG